MNNYQEPPQYKKTKPSFSTNKTLQTVALVTACAIAGFGGGWASTQLFGNNGGVSVQQVQGNANETSSIEDVSDIVEKCLPSVVEITTESVSSGNSIFGDYIQEGAGSGVIFSEDGYIVTNHHVIEGATSIHVRLSNGESYDAQLIGSDSQTDLAVLKIDAQNLTPATLGDSDSLEVGDTAIAIGNPLGELGGTVTKGIISALDREITVENETMTLLQTDAAVNPGNSGGGLFDAQGNLIGIVNAKESQTGVEGLGFSIPINGAIDIINELIEHGSVTSRPALNLSLYDYTANQQSSMESGVYIVQVVEGGAASQAGLEVGDRIVSFDNEEVNSAAEVKAILREHEIGDTVNITVSREGKMIDTQVKLQQQSTN